MAQIQVSHVHSGKLLSCSFLKHALILGALSLAASSCQGHPHSMKQEMLNNQPPPAEASVERNCVRVFNSTSMIFSYCLDLDLEGVYQLAWNVNPSTGVATVLFKGVTEATQAYPGGWAGWGISPSGRMLQSNVLVGYLATGQAVPRAALYYLSSFGPGGAELQDSPNSRLLSYVDGTLAVEASSSSSTMMVMADITGLIGVGPVFVIWKGGPTNDALDAGVLTVHTDRRRSNQLIDFSGATAEETQGEADSAQKVTHAWLVATGYGVLLPVGVFLARHGKGWFSKAWFYVHLGVQAVGYILGLAGWSYGIWLSQQWAPSFASAPADHQNHYNMGMAIFAISTVQILTPWVKPEKEEPLRVYWNWVHWTLGYVTILLAVINIFLGFNLLAEDLGGQTAWKAAYIVFLIVWAVAFLVLEVLAWVKYLRNKPEISYDRQESSSSAYDPGL